MFHQGDDLVAYISERAPEGLDIEIVLKKIRKSGLLDTALDPADLMAEMAWEVTGLTFRDYGYHLLAGRIQTDSLLAECPQTFDEYLEAMYGGGGEFQVMAKDVYDIAKYHRGILEQAIDYSRDYDFSYAGMCSFMRQYSTRIYYYGPDNKLANRLVERPQHLFMRVALGIHGDDIESVVETYDVLSSRTLMHATPTLLNAATELGQLSSCILTEIHRDSINGPCSIFDTANKCAAFSKTGSGIGIAMHNIRAKGSYIRGTNGETQGIEPMLPLFNAIARYVDQGGGKRKGGLAVYVSIDHADVLDIVRVRRPNQKNVSEFELQIGLWIPDLFMERLDEDGTWSMFCPDECPGLIDLVGDAYKEKYLEYERAGKARRTEKAVHVMGEICISLLSTGGPYILFKDPCNTKNNQNNLGPIRTSNLCTEIIQYTSPDEVAVCNLASICLPKFVRDGRIDYGELERVTRIAARNLDRVISRTKYARPEARNSNMRHRPFAIGVQGLADVAMMLGLPFTEKDFGEINRNIFETIQFAALSESSNMAQQKGAYKSFPGSLASKGIFQHNMWGVKDSDRYDWSFLREQVKACGLRNSLVTAVMPTASTSILCDNEEGIEPAKALFGSRRVLRGTYMTVCKHLQNALKPLGLWTSGIRRQIMERNKGLSLDGIDGIPPHLVEVFRTGFRMRQKHVLDLAAGRGPFVDQGQSTNLSYDAEARGEEDRISVIASMIKYGWKKKLKSGIYYLRTRPVTSELKYAGEDGDGEVSEEDACTRQEDCFTCGS